MNAAVLTLAIFILCGAITYANVTRANARDAGRLAGFDQAHRELRSKLEQEVLDRTHGLLEQGFDAGVAYMRTGRLPGKQDDAVLLDDDGIRERLAAIKAKLL